MTQEFQELIPIITEAFPNHWEEILALVFTRISGYLPLKRVKPAWDKLDSQLKSHPIVLPKTSLSLSKPSVMTSLDRIWSSNISARETNRHLIYDLSFVFSLSDNLSLAERGRNHEDIALFSGLKTGLPVILRAIPESVRDVETLLPSVDKLQLEDSILILDRGFVSEEILQGIFERNCSAIIPQRRNSTYFDTHIHLKEKFLCHKRLIRGVKREIGDRFLYLFEHKDLELEEYKTLFNNVRKGKITEIEAKKQEKLV